MVFRDRGRGNIKLIDGTYEAPTNVPKKGVKTAKAAYFPPQACLPQIAIAIKRGPEETIRRQYSVLQEAFMTDEPRSRAGLSTTEAMAKHQMEVPKRRPTRTGTEAGAEK